MGYMTLLMLATAVAVALFFGIELPSRVIRWFLWLPPFAASTIVALFIGMVGGFPAGVVCECVLYPILWFRWKKQKHLDNLRKKVEYNSSFLGEGGDAI